MDVSKFLGERLGLKWFSLAFGPATPEQARYKEVAEVRRQLGKLEDEKKLDDALEYCAGLVQREEDRSSSIESKAITLLGVTGIATGFITGFAGFLLDTNRIGWAVGSVIAAIIFALVVISLFITILLAARVVRIGDYTFTYPSSSDVFRLSDDSIEAVKFERIASLFFSAARNAKVVDKKADFLVGAQLWFRNAAVLLLVLALCVAIYMLLKAAGAVP